MHSRIECRQILDYLEAKSSDDLQQFIKVELRASHFVSVPTCSAECIWERQRKVVGYVEGFGIRAYAKTAVALAFYHPLLKFSSLAHFWAYGRNKKGLNLSRYSLFNSTNPRLVWFIVKMPIGFSAQTKIPQVKNMAIRCRSHFTTHRFVLTLEKSYQNRTLIN